MADPSLAATFRRPFAEQVTAYRRRLGNLVSTSAWDDLRHNEHDRAFMVAGAMKADLLADLAAAVDKAVAGGTTLEEFRRDFRAIVERHGWHGWTGEGTAKGEAWRTKVIFQTNMRTSYAAGRRAQLLAGNFALWVYRHSGAEHPRLHHLAWDGVALPPDHAFWRTNSPPNGWGCGCGVYGARTRAGVRRVGGDPDKQLPEGWNIRDPKTGMPPGIEKGWDYAPGASTAGEIAETVTALAGKLPRLPAPIGAALFHNFPARAHGALDQEFRHFLQRSLSEHVQQRHMIIGALKPDWITAAAGEALHIESAEIAITDKNIQHAFRGTGHVTVESTRRTDRQPKVDPLDLDWFADLPRHLRNPRAVLLDQTQREPVFVLVYDVPGSVAKLVVEVNTPLKKVGGLLNTVQSGRLVSVNDLVASKGAGVRIIEGEI